MAVPMGEITRALVGVRRRLCVKWGFVDMDVYEQEYANITELDAATLNRLIKEIVVHERIDEDKTRHISIEIHFNLKPIPEVEQVTA